MVLKTVIVSCVNQKTKLKVSCFNLPMKKHGGFGFKDPGPALRYGSLAKLNQRLTGP